MPSYVRGRASMFSETKYRRDIQALRGLAVLAVVLFHAKESYSPLGYLGVDVFFVISGFVVTPLILRIFSDQINVQRRLSNLKDFYKRRFYRLAPALAVVLIFSTVIIVLLGPISDHQKFARQGIATLLLAGNLGAFRYSGDYFSPNPNPLVHTWSLSVEEQIYIFLPLILMLFLLNRKSVKKVIVVIFGFISVISFISFLFPNTLQPLYSQVGIQLPSLFSFYSPIDRIWQFTLGGLGFLLLDSSQSHRWKISRRSNLVAVMAIVTILFGPIQMSLKVSSIFASFFAVIVIVFRSLDLLPEILISKLEWLGDRSYSIYLVHMPLLYIAQYSPAVQIGGSENRIIQSAIAVVTTILLGALSFSKIENRFRDRGKSDQISLKNLATHLTLTLLIPLMFLLVTDRAAVSFRVDANLPKPSKPLPWEWDSKCEVMGSTFEIEKPCVYGNKKSTKSLLLIGDSHAASNSKAIIEIAQTNNIKVSVFTQSSCPFILNKIELSAKFELPGLDSNCLSHNKAILDFVNIYKPTITILSMRSTSEYIFPNTALSRILYRENVLKSLSNLRQSETNMILIGAEPEYIPIKTWVQRIFGSTGRFSEIPLEDSRWWSTALLDDFQYLNTIEIFCPQNLCKNKAGSIWLFNDEQHLSKEGAEMLLPELGRLVKEILNRNP